MNTESATEPYVLAQRLSLATREGPVFSDVSFSIERSQLAVVLGGAGTGRSALLLALAGRMRGITGDLRIAGLDGIRETREIRKITSLARISHLVDLEGQLSVGDSLTERALIDGVRPERAEIVFGHAEILLDCHFNRHQLVDELDALEAALLALALACLRPAHIVLLDDLDRQLDLIDQRQLVAALLRLTETGTTVIATTTEVRSLPDDVNVIALTHHKK